MELERERKDIRETAYQKEPSSDYEEDDQYKFKEVINLGDLMSAKRAKQRGYPQEYSERELEGSPQQCKQS